MAVSLNVNGAVRAVPAEPDTPLPAVPERVKAVLA
jgi:hypothetical protein